jgi:hypothetical protein
MEKPPFISVYHKAALLTRITVWHNAQKKDRKIYNLPKMNKL